MIIKSTNKLLNLSRIKTEPNLNDPEKELPGEWYADVMSMFIPGKYATVFLHNPTYITILIQGKSLNKTCQVFPIRVKNLLERHGLSGLETRFELDSEISIYKTNSRSLLAHLNQIKYSLEYHFALAESLEEIDYNQIEDHYLEFLFGGKNIKPRFVKPINILHDLLEN